MLKLGFNCSGTEKVFEKILREQIEQSHDRSDMFVYLECGIAEGTTLKAVADVCLEYSKQEPWIKWNAIGIDLYGGAFFNAQNFLNQVAGHNVFIVTRRHFGIMSECNNDQFISVLLLPDGQSVGTKSFPEQSIHFAVIDGCHGAPCVERDFLAIEKAIAPGGIVAFHDAMPEDQGGEPGTNGWQSHCKSGIDVISALAKLDLAYVRAGAGWRKGWEPFEQVRGDKSANPPGNGFAFFRRIE